MFILPKGLSEYVSALTLFSIALALTQGFALFVSRMASNFTRAVASFNDLRSYVHVEIDPPYKYVLVDPRALDAFYTDSDYQLINTSSVIVIRVEEFVSVTLVLEEGVLIV